MKAIKENIRLRFSGGEELIRKTFDDILILKKLLAEARIACARKALKALTECCEENAKGVKAGTCAPDPFCAGNPPPGPVPLGEGGSFGRSPKNESAGLPIVTGLVTDESPFQQGRSISKQNVSAEDRIFQIVSELADLLAPHLIPGQPIPQAILDQANNLIAQADAVAGGDAVRFLEDQVRQGEAEIERLSGSVDFTGRDVPDYPVLYAATIIRSNSVLVARGKTEARGQYSLFVPRDGTLNSVSFYDPKTRSYDTIFPLLRTNNAFQLPRFDLVPVSDALTDSDQDGLPDLAESVYGTDPHKADTDGDGIKDGAESDQGTNPLDGLIAVTGIIGSADTPGTAVDVCAVNNIALVADSEAGIAVFNVLNGMNPVIIGQVDTPGVAQRVSCSGTLVAVADGPAGLAVIDISDPPTAFIARQIRFGRDALSVTTVGNLAFVGLQSGEVYAVDMSSGALLHRVVLGAAVQDLVLGGDFLYGLTDLALHVLSFATGELVILGQTPSPYSAGPNRRLFIGGGIAYAVHGKGYNTFSLTNSAVPSLLKQGDTTQFGWKQIVLNGSGLGLAAVSPNSSFDGPHDVSLYDVSDPLQTDQFLTTFETPGIARAVSIFNALAYVADHDRGMHVINYLAYDSKGVPPANSLVTSFSGNQAEEGQFARLTANVSDDVQVRNVEFYLDGQLVVTDGNFPFEHRFVVPPLTPAKNSFQVRSRATDTGGNSIWSEELNVTITRDATPPRLLRVSPFDGAKLGGLKTISAFFSEVINSAKLSQNTFSLIEAGPDGLLKTPDDARVTSGVIAFRSDSLTALMSFDSGLPFGLYQVTLTTGIADLAGNPLAAAFESRFELREITVVAEEGTPTDAFQASANVGQVITIESAGLGADSVVSFPARDSLSRSGQRNVPVSNVAPGSRFGQVIIPDDADTGLIKLPDNTTLFLQIVPTIAAISGGRARLTRITGSGFIEGLTTARFGGVHVNDQGPGVGDGIDVYDSGGENRSLDVTVPPEGTLPYEVITEGGRSGGAADVTRVPSIAQTGTAANAGEASANVDQDVTLEGEGFVTGVTRVLLEAINSAGTASISTLTPSSVAADGRSLVFKVPSEARTGIASILNGGSGKLLQIVPRVSQIRGGQGRATTFFGSGFTEGLTTVRFGAVQVKDQGPNINDGIDVYETGGENRGLDVTVPPEGTLPYEVITEGGRSGGAADVTRVPSIAQTGTAAKVGEASANVDQDVTLEGEGFVTGVTRVLLEAMNSAGTALISTLTPSSVAADGRSLVFKVPSEARTGIASILNGGSGKLLQIVPRVSLIRGGQGRATTFFGSGFTEGLTSVRFGAVQVKDQGPNVNDGIDVYETGGENRGLDVTVPAGGTLPYEVITEGGASGRVEDVTRVASVAQTGIAANAGEASANVDQDVTLEGEGFVAGATKVVLEGMNSVGTPSISTLTPGSVAADGRSLIFKVPSEARTGIASILNGGGGKLLQIVPTVTSASSFTPGGFSTLLGSGFIEGLTTVRFGAVGVNDQGPSFDDGIDVYETGGENRGLLVTVPVGGSPPVVVITAGGTSNGVTP